MPREFVTVTRKHPCPICEKPDWCGVSSDGEIAVCMRAESSRQARNGGWVHVIADKRGRWTPPPAPRCSIPACDMASTLREWAGDMAVSKHSISQLASNLCVSSGSLEALGAVWATGHSAWAFPMKDHLERVIGIRLRNDEGRKWAVKGSKSGLFIPFNSSPSPLVICEGPTDTAAAWTIGFRTIGRPSCLGCEDEIAKYASRTKTKDIIIVADRDAPGQRGASKLSEALSGFRVWIVTLPFCKDLREFVRSGGQADMVMAMVKNQIPKARR